ncbi:hypothetical protein [Azospirillum sp. B2RO_4]|uniref:hypothetical protein n=1 Tax=Azospirillum sp. B2RO_4 TaxID=3027796 RepID=UPI003DA9C4EE
MTIYVTGTTMSDEQRKAILEAIERANERAERDAGFAKEMLVREGVYEENGEPGKHYR